LFKRIGERVNLKKMKGNNFVEYILK